MASWGKVREEVVNVVLSRLLEEYGLSGVALAKLDGIPDIYVLLRGVRVIVETKEEGFENDLRRQLKERLVKRLCEVAVGVIYPSQVVKGGLGPPTTKEVENSLVSAELNAITYILSSTGPIEVGEVRSTVPQLPELLNRVAGESMPKREIQDAIDHVRDSVNDFVSRIGSLGNASDISEKIGEALDLGK